MIEHGQDIRKTTQENIRFEMRRGNQRIKGSNKTNLQKGKKLEGREEERKKLATSY